MKLLLIRHAIAEEREDFARTGKDDRLRPLTDAGRRKMRRNAKGLRELVPEIDLLATSPLTRAAQTAAILDSVYKGLSEVEIEELAPETAPDAFLGWLKKRQEEEERDLEMVAAVGHEPSLGHILAFLLTGQPRSQGPALLDFRKGGACLLDFPEEIAAGRAVLRWALTPKQLRAFRK